MSLTELRFVLTQAAYIVGWDCELLDTNWQYLKVEAPAAGLNDNPDVIQPGHVDSDGADAGRFSGAAPER